MAETLSATVLAQLDATLTGSTAALGQPTFSPLLSTLFNIVFANGSGANQANQMYVDQRTLASGANDSINLYDFGGALDQVGSARTLTKLKVLYIENKSAVNTDYLSIGNNATGAAFVSIFGTNTDIIKLRGNGRMLLVCPDANGWAVVNGTNHLLKILNSGAGSVTYNIVVIGAT